MGHYNYKAGDIFPNFKAYLLS